MKQVITIYSIVEESSKPLRRSGKPMDMIKPPEMSRKLVTLPFKKVRILHEGILQALEDRKKMAGLVEAVIVKPISLGATFNNVEVKIVILENRLHRKFDFVFTLRLVDPEQIKDQIISKMHEGLAGHFNALRDELSALEDKIFEVG